MKESKVVGDCGSGKQVAGSNSTTPTIEKKRAKARAKESGSSLARGRTKKRLGTVRAFLLGQGSMDRQTDRNSHMKIREPGRKANKKWRKKKKKGRKYSQAERI